MKQLGKHPKALAAIAVWLVCALLLTACGAGSASGSEPAAQANAAASSLPASSFSEPEPEPEPEPIVTTLRFSATGDNLIHNGLYLQAAQRAGGEGYDFGALYENIAPDRKSTRLNSSH